jgi:3,4-dihydroxy 2-butanone 4-phosphate synthase/GTP cyclohydrolase II
MTSSHDLAIARVLKAIEVVRDGGMVIMVDDEDRENEGDLVFAAEHVSPEKVNFMTKEARGLICLSLDGPIVDRLKLPMMEDSTKRGGGKSTAFTVSIEARHGVTTGISAADRAQTIKVAVADGAGPDDLTVPGHVFPLRARAGGVLQRAGHTEGSVDLAQLAGLKPAAVICEIMNDDGTMARMPDLERFAERHQMPIVTIADLITFKLLKDSLIEELASAPVPTTHGTYRGVLFRSLIDGVDHLALVKGEALDQKIVDVRVHRQRPLLDVFGRASEGASLIEYGLKMLATADAGVLLYLSHASGSSEGLAAEFSALTGGVQPTPARSWLDADPRMLGIGAQILRRLGVRQMRVHMTNPKPLKGLHGFDLEVVDTVDISRT